MNWISLLSLPIGYLLGSISSAYIIGKLIGKIDVRDETDGHISAAAVYRRVGLFSFLAVVVMDIGKALLAVLVAQWLQATPEVTMATGILTVAGHQWSMFLRFQGGLGATAIGGVLAGIATVSTLIGGAVAGLLVWGTKRSSMSFGVGVIVAFMVLFAMRYSPIVPPLIMVVFPPSPFLIAYPLILGLMMVLKAVQVKYRPGAPLLKN